MTIKVEQCNHPNFTAAVVVNRVLDVKRFVADVTIKCVACGEPFRFIGLGCGLSYEEPQVSLDGKELRVPIAPASDLSLSVKGPLGYKITQFKP